MLVLFYGPSGVGKTTLMRSLKAQKGWNIIPTFMTRKVREDEDEKVEISESEFASMVLDEKFFCTTSLFGVRYGTPLHSVIDSSMANNTEVSMLDFALTNAHLFEAIPHISVVLVPENWEQLHSQLVGSGRSARISEVYIDYFKNYHDPQNLCAPGTLVVVSKRHRPESAVAEVSAHIGGASL